MFYQLIGGLREKNLTPTVLFIDILNFYVVQYLHFLSFCQACITMLVKHVLKKTKYNPQKHVFGYLNTAKKNPNKRVSDVKAQ